jgi:hypothetical protein
MSYMYILDPSQSQSQSQSSEWFAKVFKSTEAPPIDKDTTTNNSGHNALAYGAITQWGPRPNTSNANVNANMSNANTISLKVDKNPKDIVSSKVVEKSLAISDDERSHDKVCRLKISYLSSSAILYRHI